MHFYLTFAYFKLAVILQQIYARYVAGQTADERFAQFGKRVQSLILHAHALSQREEV
jgi:aminoglycoside phosphotransferase (APT) family kinase protein